MLKQLYKVCTFTIAPATAGWFLVYIVNHPWVQHRTAPLPPIWNWIIFIVASMVSISGYIISINETIVSLHDVRRCNRRIDTDRPKTGRRITDK
jgi:hypothetical protein